MRQRDQVEAVSSALTPKLSANHQFELFAIDELGNGQPSNGNDELGPKNFDFVSHPGRTVANFIRRRHAIRASRRLSRKTAADRGKINFRADVSLIHSAKLIEPTKKGLPGGVSERPLQSGLARAW